MSDIFTNENPVDVVTFQLGERIVWWKCATCGTVNENHRLRPGEDHLLKCECGASPPEPTGHVTVTSVDKDAGTFTVSE